MQFLRAVPYGTKLSLSDALAQAQREWLALACKDDDPDGDWDDFADPGEEFPQIPGRNITFPPGQLQAKYKHAMKYLGFPNYNKATEQKLADLLRNFINSPETEKRVGTYRKDEVIHYRNHDTEMNVMTEPDGALISFFKLDEDQLKHWPDIGGS